MRSYSVYHRSRPSTNHLKLSVIDYEHSVAFYDQMFGWRGYKSFWTMDIGYHSTYYTARFLFPHSYIGLRPAKSGQKLDFGEHPVGIHHIALWSSGRTEINRFYKEFLLPNNVPVAETPEEYPVYAPGYYAVFFDDPINGFHLELAHMPKVATPSAYRRTFRAWKEAKKQHPE